MLLTDCGSRASGQSGLSFLICRMQGRRQDQSSADPRGSGCVHGIGLGLTSSPRPLALTVPPAPASGTRREGGGGSLPLPRPALGAQAAAPLHWAPARLRQCCGSHFQESRASDISPPLARAQWLQGELQCRRGHLFCRLSSLPFPSWGESPPLLHHVLLKWAASFPPSLRGGRGTHTDPAGQCQGSLRGPQQLSWLQPREGSQWREGDRTIYPCFQTSLNAALPIIGSPHPSSPFDRVSQKLHFSHPDLS